MVPLASECRESKVKYSAPWCGKGGEAFWFQGLPWGIERVVYEDARYHVIQRGHNKNFITNILQLQYILGYIAYNPVRARLVRNLEDYHWSSYFDLKNNQRSIVNENKLVECYADDPQKGLAAYFTHMEMFTQQLHTKEAALLLGKANAGELLGEILENLPISAQNRHLLQMGIINIITRPCRNTFIKEAYSQEQSSPPSS
jgi:hypothetical protein